MLEIIYTRDLAIVCKWSMPIKVSYARSLFPRIVDEVVDPLRGIVSRKGANALELLPSEEVNADLKGPS